MPNAGTRRVLEFGVLLLVLVTNVTSQAQSLLEWKDAHGDAHSLTELREILQKHYQWRQSGYKSGKKADLK
jgi:hypothetical protein